VQIATVLLASVRSQKHPPIVLVARSKHAAVGVRSTLSLLKLDLEVVSRLVTMPKPETTLNDKEDQCPDINCETNEWI